MKNKIEDLRNHLFATLEALQDEEKPMDIERARAVAEVAQTIINSAKVEVDLVKTMGATSCSEFFKGVEVLPPSGSGDRPKPKLVGRS